MKIITWNVNSVRVRLDRLLALLERHQPDVVCLQETKATDDVFPRLPIEQAGYHVAIHGQKSYNGVAIVSREPVENVEHGFDNNPVPEQARVILADIPGGPRVVNLYVVNGKALGTEAYDIKLAWLDALTAWLAAKHDPSDPLLLCGDFNIAPDDRDVYDPKIWKDRVLVSDPERDRLRSLLDWGLQDLLRVHTDEAGHFTWWDYRHGALHRGWGLRIDLMLATKTLATRSVSIEVDREERKASTGEGKPSDHAPLMAEFE